MTDDTSSHPVESTDSPPVASDIAAPDANPGESSAPDEKGAAEPQNPLDVVTEALKDLAPPTPEGDSVPSPEVPPASETEPDQDATPETAKAETEAEEDATPGPEGDGEDTRFDKHPRFKQLIDQRNEARAETEKLQAQVEEFKADHESMVQLNDFLDSKQISTEEANQALDIVALIKSDPKQALEVLSPIVLDLAEQTGRVLPGDLRTRVENREIDQASAQKLAQERGALARERQSVEAQQAENLQGRRNLAVSAVESWMEAKKQSDPDFSRKELLLTRMLPNAMGDFERTGQIPSPADARKIVEDTYKFVSEQLASANPKTAETPIVPIAGANPPAPVQREPKSQLDVVNMALEQTRTGAA